MSDPRFIRRIAALTVSGDVTVEVDDAANIVLTCPVERFTVTNVDGFVTALRDAQTYAQAVGALPLEQRRPS